MTRTPEPLLVVALGGNALLKRTEPPDMPHQRANVEVAAAQLAELAVRHRLIVTHGNGPQVGLLALQADASGTQSPLDVLGAETEGMIGYLIEQSLRNRIPDTTIATLLTQVLVSPDDRGFANPTKPIGRVYDETEARRLAHQRGWNIAADGDGFRRVVASPEPREVVEIETIRLLLASGVIVVCAGGGGIPVVADAHGRLHGVEAVIDKDLSASLLAQSLDADMLLMLTDVPAVESDWGTPASRAISSATPDELRSMRFASGSMGPKVEAACRFVDATGSPAAIGSLAEAAAVVSGIAGTCVRRGPRPYMPATGRRRNRSHITTSNSRPKGRTP